MTQYLLSINQPDGPPPPSVDLGKVMRDVNVVIAEMKATGAWVFNGGLHPASTATVVRFQAGEVLITDGPYAEGKEHVGGLCIINATDLDVAEEAVQDAFVAAVQRWPATGLPPSPAGWIITTARNRAIDRLRREASRDDRHAQAALLQARNEPAEEGDVPDDRLRLIFTCCHPALAQAAQVRQGVV